MPYILLYHDILDNQDAGASGLSGPGADRYKLDRAEFVRHLDAIERRVAHAPARASELGDCPATATGWMLTFDDGGASALVPTADLLDERRWAGHFFVTAGRIGTSGFLSEAGIRELRARGHLIGSHSWSHPTRFSALSPDRMRDEWARSVDRLAEILDEPVTVASVPGGYYRPAAAAAASRAGIRILFTSEPIARPLRAHGCVVLGRFSIRRDTPAADAAALAAGSAYPRARQWIAWNGRKIVKRLTGDLYTAAREALLARRAL
jgi:peptidoglycan/xylan/chitin deacetylase (PgdA/CDA1 family)